MNREIWWAINTVRNVGAISKSVRKKRASLVFASYEIIEFHEERGGRRRRVLSTGFRPSAPRFICSCQSQISTFDAYLLLSCLSHPLDRAVPACPPPSPLLFFHSIRATVFDCVMPVEPYQMDALSSLFLRFLIHLARSIDANFGDLVLDGTTSIGYIVSFVIPVKTIETKQVEPGIDRYRTLISTS